MSLRSVTTAFVTFAALALGSSACTADRPTGVVAGMSTQMLIPRDLRAIRILAKATSGALIFDQTYVVADGKVSLPATLTFAPADGVGRGQSILISILGYEVEPEEEVRARDPLPVSMREAAAPRILRRVVLGYDQGRVAYLPLNLSYSCLGVQCDRVGETCVAGKCVNQALDVATLPTYVEGLFEANSEACFDATRCMSAMMPAQLANVPDMNAGVSASVLDRCTFRMPAKDAEGRSLSIPAGTPINVRVVFGRANDDAASSMPRAEILDYGSDGFTVPDPSQPEVFRLSPGLCDAANAARSSNLTTEVYIAPTAFCRDGSCTPAMPLCATKLPTQSLCDHDLAKTGPAGTGGSSCQEKALTPSPSVMGLLIDRRDTLRGPLTSPAFSTLIGLPLSGSLLRKTQVAVAFTPPRGTGNACSNALVTSLYRTPGNFDTLGVDAGKPVFGIGWTPAASAVSSFSALQRVTNLLAGPAFPFGTPEYINDYEGFMQANPAGFDRALASGGFYEAIREKVASDQAAKGALFVIGSRDFAGTCDTGNGAVAAAGAALTNTTTPLATYVLDIRDSNKFADLAGFAQQARALATAGGTEAFIANGEDGGEMTMKGLEALTRAAVDVATCTYEPDSGLATTSALHYMDLEQKLVSIPGNPSCSGGVGWKSEGNRVKLCETSCNDYRAVVRGRGLVSALSGATLDEVPIVLRSGCTN
jgi:hypothetical protein